MRIEDQILICIVFIASQFRKKIWKIEVYLDQVIELTTSTFLDKHFKGVCAGGTLCARVPETMYVEVKDQCQYFSHLISTL